MHEDLRAADADQLADFLADLVVGQRIRIGIFVIAPKGAEGAFGGADVGVVDVTIDDVRAIIFRMQPLGDRVRPFAQIVHRGVVIKLQCLGIAQPRSAGDHIINIERQLCHNYEKCKAATNHSLWVSRVLKLRGILTRGIAENDHEETCHANSDCSSRGATHPHVCWDAIVVLTVLLFYPSAGAATTGTVNGTVVDSDGKVVPNQKVRDQEGGEPGADWKTRVGQHGRRRADRRHAHNRQGWEIQPIFRPGEYWAEAGSKTLGYAKERITIKAGEATDVKLSLTKDDATK